MISPHGPEGAGVYAKVFAALLALTGLTVWVAFFDLGVLNLPVALAIACLKASLVLLFFMHLRWSPRWNLVAAGAGILFVVLLLALGVMDFLTRV